MAHADSDDALSEMLRIAGEWQEYDDSLRAVNRSVVGNPSYFDALLSECMGCLTEWHEPRSVFRARLMPPDRQDVPFDPSEMGAPPAGSTPGGRLNPAGISYLYAALDAQTAIAEVRPWIHARLTVCRFETIGRVRVVDLTDLNSHITGRKRPAFAGFMMQRPTHRDDAVAYVATQHLAETLKARGVDAISYGSGLRRDGVNVAFFREELARAVATQLWLVSMVSYTARDLTDMKAGHRAHDA